MFIGIANALSKFRKTSLPYIKNNLKLYLDFKSNKSDTLKFPCEGSTSFDGVDDYIDCGDINAMDGASQLTMSAWMKRFASDDIVVVEKSTDNNDRVGLHLGSDGKIYYIMSTGSGITHGSVALAGTDWNYVVGVFDGSLADNASRLKIYVNGVLQTLAFSGTIPATTPSSSAPLLIGKDIPNSQFSTGKMANVAIWNRVLSIEEINSVMRKNYSQLGSVEKTSLVMWQSLDSVDATGHMDTPGTSTTILTSFPTNIYLNSHGTTEYTEVMANNGNLTTQGAWNFQSGGTDSAFADTGVYSEGALKIKNVVIARVAVNSTNASVLEALIVGQLYKLEITYTRVEGQHAQAVYIGLNNSYGGSGSDVKWKEGYWNTDDDDAAEKTITGYFFHESGKNELWIRCPSSSIELHFKTISLKKVTNNAGGGGITPSHNNNHYDATLAQGATTTTSVYGGNAPVLPRAVDVAKEGQADAIGDGSALLNGSSDFVQVEDSSVLDAPASWTLSAWIKIGSGTSGYDRIIGKQVTGGQCNYGIGLKDGTDFGTFINDGGGFNDSNYHSTDLIVGEWYHVTGTWDGTYLKSYINGILVETSSDLSSSNASVTNTAPLLIGRNATNGDQYFKGNISQAGAWQGVLTQAQIQSVMESTSYAKIPADVKSTLGSELITLSVTDSWTGSNVSVNEASTDYAYSGTQSRKYTTSASGGVDGITSNTFTTVLNSLYKLDCWVYSPSQGDITVRVLQGDGSGYSLDEEVTIATGKWVNIIRYFKELGGGASSEFFVGNNLGSAVTQYVDNVSVKLVTNDLVGYWGLDAVQTSDFATKYVPDSLGGELGSELFTGWENNPLESGVAYKGWSSFTTSGETVTASQADEGGVYNKVFNTETFSVVAGTAYEINMTVDSVASVYIRGFTASTNSESSILVHDLLWNGLTSGVKKFVVLANTTSSSARLHIRQFGANTASITISAISIKPLSGNYGRLL